MAVAERHGQPKVWFFTTVSIAGYGPISGPGLAMDEMPELGLTSASAVEAEQLVVRRGNPLPLFEQDLRRHPRKRHPIAAVAERECMVWVAPVRADVGQAVWRDREDAIPRVVDADAGKRWQMGLEVLAQLSRAFSEQALQARPRRTVGATEQQPMIRGPSHVVIRPFGVPQHDGSQTKLASIASGERMSREHKRVAQPEASCQRTKLPRRIPCGDHHSSGVDGAAVGVQAYAMRPLLDAADARPLEDRRAVTCGGVQQTKARTMRIQLRVAASADRAGCGESG